MQSKPPQPKLKRWSSRSLNIVYPQNESEIPPVALAGKGFFVLKEGDSVCYSRGGQWQLDAKQVLVDAQSRPVLGWPADARSPHALSSLTLPAIGSVRPGKYSDRVSISMPLQRGRPMSLYRYLQQHTADAKPTDREPCALDNQLSLSILTPTLQWERLQLIWVKSFAPNRWHVLAKLADRWLQAASTIDAKPPSPNRLTGTAGALTPQQALLPRTLCFNAEGEYCFNQQPVPPTWLPNRVVAKPQPVAEALRDFTAADLTINQVPIVPIANADTLSTHGGFTSGRSVAAAINALTTTHGVQASCQPTVIRTNYQPLQQAGWQLNGYRLPVYPHSDGLMVQQTKWLAQVNACLPAELYASVEASQVKFTATDGRNLCLERQAIRRIARARIELRCQPMASIVIGGRTPQYFGFKRGPVAGRHLGCSQPLVFQFPDSKHTLTVEIVECFEVSEVVEPAHGNHSGFVAGEVTHYDLKASGDIGVRYSEGPHVQIGTLACAHVPDPRWATEVDATTWQFSLNAGPIRYHRPGRGNTSEVKWSRLNASLQGYNGYPMAEQKRTHPYAHRDKRLTTGCTDLDVAIDGQGMFVLQDAQGWVFSRVGAFGISKHGRLTDWVGRQVFGLPQIATHRPIQPQDLVPIQVTTARSHRPTRQLLFKANLNCDRMAVGFSAHSPLNSRGTPVSNLHPVIKHASIVDLDGQKVNLTFAFFKLAAGPLLGLSVSLGPEPKIPAIIDPELRARQKFMVLCFDDSGHLLPPAPSDTARFFGPTPALSEPLAVEAEETFLAPGALSINGVAIREEAKQNTTPISAGRLAAIINTGTVRHGVIAQPQLTTLKLPFAHPIWREAVWFINELPVYQIYESLAQELETCDKLVAYFRKQPALQQIGLDIDPLPAASGLQFSLKSGDNIVIHADKHALYQRGRVALTSRLLHQYIAIGGCCPALFGFRAGVIAGWKFQQSDAITLDKLEGDTARLAPDLAIKLDVKFESRRSNDFSVTHDGQVGLVASHYAIKEGCLMVDYQPVGSGQSGSGLTADYSECQAELALARPRVLALRPAPHHGWRLPRAHADRWRIERPGSAVVEGELEDLSVAPQAGLRPKQVPQKLRA